MMGLRADARVGRAPSPPRADRRARVKSAPQIREGADGRPGRQPAPCPGWAGWRTAVRSGRRFEGYTRHRTRWIWRHRTRWIGRHRTRWRRHRTRRSGRRPRIGDASDTDRSTWKRISSRESESSSSSALSPPIFRRSAAAWARAEALARGARATWRRKPATSLSCGAPTASADRISRRSFSLRVVFTSLARSATPVGEPEPPDGACGPALHRFRRAAEKPREVRKAPRIADCPHRLQRGKRHRQP